MFSLILCTINRKDDVERFLLSILNSRANIEVIIIDQNSQPILDTIVSKFHNKLNILHIKTSIKGLSRARNLGLTYAKGEFIAFPDDDCFYSKNLLENIYMEFKNENLDFISIKTVDPDDNTKSLIYCPPKTHMILMNSIAGCSFTYFFKNTNIFRSINFSNEMGVGSNTPYGSGEETDFITNLIYLGAKGIYLPNIIVYHKAKEHLYNKETLTRMKLYGGGYGYYVRKNIHILGCKNTTRLLLAPFARIILRSRTKNDLIKSLFFFKGFIIGFFKIHKNKK